ncbi:MAG: RagB/SusD family nutrient uptake outer membrane protein [Candidatus Bacteroides intestinipullorum]|uniref:RagB/SusD family nutrient uptake outer membrane protein n=1 Tax=Candidatus Bacteroides intestinipullorum TaxID=2838471 RepID=A0A9E2KF75_9BACE|nr:RagB/SusD family nutrient uptake outer membrane protein [Candidatus Bacteroides intestinipullorum]
MKKIYLLISSILCLGLSSCFDMDQEPQGEISTAGAFSTTSEIRMYLNMFYQGSVPVSGGGTVSNSAIKGHQSGTTGGIAMNEVNSDNMYSNALDTRLAGATSLGSAAVLNDYKPIRNVNFLLQNIENCQDRGAEYEQCLGEAYYFRAAYYYNLLKNYGGVTWVDQPLDPDTELMRVGRNTRTEIADYILSDLDNAIANLNEQSSNATGRVHRDVARALKSEVALFAATWEKYHRAENDPFYDDELTDWQAKVNDWLNQAVEAAQAVIDRGVWQIYDTDNPLSDYNDMFKQIDMSANQEVLWWRQYNSSASVGHATTRYLGNGGGQCGVSSSLVDDYLTIEGRPFVGTEKMEAKRTYGTELSPEVRDPRLSQTVFVPGQTLRTTPMTIFEWPPLNGSSFNQNMTGYSVRKYVEWTSTDQNIYNGDRNSQAGAIQVRYADILLNYAEALAELDGAANAQRIISALHPLRDRVGMPDVDFQREYNTEADYPFRNLDPYIQAVRRERRVEKALEACRLTDILRWAAADELIVGKTPTGALFTGSDLEHAYDDDDNPIVEGSNIRLTGSVGDAERYIVPCDMSSYPNGWQFNVNRDYLLPIRTDMLGEVGLTGGMWEQNPGW